MFKGCKYNAETGVITRRGVPLHSENNGYLCAYYHGDRVYAHRLAWFLFYGEWPRGQIDHIDHDKQNNKITNLRVVSIKTNHKNMSLFSTNTSGRVGVYWCKAKKKWAAQICVNRRVIPLGRYSAKADAINARRAAEIKHGFHKNHGSLNANRRQAGGNV